jgi:hypothetical protein
MAGFRGTLESEHSGRRHAQKKVTADVGASYLTYTQQEPCSLPAQTLGHARAPSRHAAPELHLQNWQGRDGRCSGNPAPGTNGTGPPFASGPRNDLLDPQPGRGLAVVNGLCGELFRVGGKEGQLPTKSERLGASRADNFGGGWEHHLQLSPTAARPHLITSHFESRCNKSRLAESPAHFFYIYASKTEPGAWIPRPQLKTSHCLRSPASITIPSVIGYPTHLNSECGSHRQGVVPTTHSTGRIETKRGIGIARH